MSICLCVCVLTDTKLLREPIERERKSLDALILYSDNVLVYTFAFAVCIIIENGSIDVIRMNEQ